MSVIEDKQTDLSFDEERELTPEEEQLIRDYVMNSCTEDEKPVGELIVKWLFSKNPFEGYLKMQNNVRRNGSHDMVGLRIAQKE